MDAATALHQMRWHRVLRQEYPTESELSGPVPTRSGWAAFVYVINPSDGVRVIRTPFAVGDVDERTGTVAFQRRTAAEFGLSFADRIPVQTEAEYQSRFASSDERVRAHDAYLVAANRARDEWLGRAPLASSTREEFLRAFGATRIERLAPAYHSLSPSFFSWTQGVVGA